MAIRYDATADYLEFVSGPTGAVTVGGWFQVLGSLKFSSCITFSNLAPGSNAGTASGASMIDTNGSLGGYIASARDLGIDVATGDWFFLAVSRSGAGDDVATEWRLHGSTLTGALQSIGPYSGYNYMPGNRIQIATSPYAATYSEHLDGASGPIWVFDSVLSAAQIDLLRRRLVPPIVPWAWIPGIWPGSDRVKDFSGNGRNFTPAGTLADVDGPPIPWGAQIIVPEYATVVAPVLSLPGVQNITASSATPKVTLTF